MSVVKGGEVGLQLCLQEFYATVNLVSSYQDLTSECAVPVGTGLVWDERMTEFHCLWDERYLE